MARFWSNVALAKPSECWPWKLGSNPGGYGRFYISGIASARAAHRIMWLITRGSLPADQHVLHTCDNPPCCNPTHLYIGDDLANARDRDTRRRRKARRGEAHPRAKLTDQDVVALRERADEDPRALAQELSISAGHAYSLLAHRVRGEGPPVRRPRKLTPSQVDEIRTRWSESSRALAREFGVSKTTIQHIRNNKIHRR